MRDDLTDRAGERTAAGAPRARVWDAPTRVFHWLLALAFLGEWLTQDARDLDLHVFLGYVIGALVVFRLVWGVVGTRWARFSSFAFTPAAALRYLRAMRDAGKPHYTGHNPAGSWSIYALLALAAAAVASGVAALGGGVQQGPLAGTLGFAAGDVAHEVHEVVAYAMLVVVGLHVAGVIAGSIVDRENLARAMLTGVKRASAEGVPARGGIALTMIAVLAAGAALYFRGYAGASPDAPYLPFRAPALAQDATWTGECGDCHLAYHPSLLPARSWDAMLAQQNDHFGEDLGLDDEVIAELRAFAHAHSAETTPTPVAWKIATRTAPSATPLRITETGYWRRAHADLTDRDWQQVKRLDCEGCHRDALAGTFLPGAIRIGIAVPGATRHARKPS